MKFDFLRRAPLDHYISLNDHSRYQITLTSLLVNLHVMHLQELQDGQLQKNIEVRMESTCLISEQVHDEVNCHSEVDVELKKKIDSTIRDLFSKFFNFNTRDSKNKIDRKQIREFLGQKVDLALVAEDQIEILEQLLEDFCDLVVSDAVNFQMKSKKMED